MLLFEQKLKMKKLIEVGVLDKKIAFGDFLRQKINQQIDYTFFEKFGAKIKHFD